MLTVITGVSASGKSAYAEKRAVSLAAGGALYYVATMEPLGEEGGRRIERHRRLREGRGFTTIECYREIGRALDGIEAADRREAVVLLECLPNLLANEMFPPEETAPAAAAAQCGAEGGAEEDRSPGTEEWEGVAAGILTGIAELRRQCRQLLLVTGEVSLDGRIYGRGTQVYIRLLGELNQKLAAMADEVVEVVYTIPIKVKLCKPNEGCTDGGNTRGGRKDNT